MKKERFQAIQCLTRVNQRRLRDLRLGSTLSMRFQATQNLAVARMFRVRKRTKKKQSQVMIMVSGTADSVIIVLFAFFDFVREDTRIFLETLASLFQSM